MSKLEEMNELRRKAEGQKRTGPETAKSICERILTVPSGPAIARHLARATRRTAASIKIGDAHRLEGIPLQSFGQ